MAKASDGQEKTLLKLGPFRVIGRCDPDNAAVYLRSTVGDSSDQVAFHSGDYNGWIAVSPGGKRV